jgi:hypothetical protein
MLRFALVCVSVCFSSVAFSQTSTSGSANTPTAPLQIVYAIDGSILSTYNVDSQTLQATLVGTTTLPQSTYPMIVPSANGRVLYYTAFQNINRQGQRLYVYKTDSSGVPQGEPVQSVGVKNLYSLQVDPTSKFLYAVRPGIPGPAFQPFSILRYAVDPDNGTLSQPVVEATYKLDYNYGSESCSLSIFGMNSAGTFLYDEIFCNYPHGGVTATYNELTINPSTGALGPDQQVVTWDNSSGGGDQVQILNNLLFEFVMPNDFQQDNNMVNVFALPNMTAPPINCTGPMLAACADDQSGLAHPSAEYVFLENFQSNSVTTEIEKVDWSSTQIVPTGSTIPYEVQQFSGDGTIAYCVNDVNGALTIEIYGFNVATAAVTAGGTISVPSDLDSWWAVERR